MRFLLDTHALLWWLFDDPQLSVTVREIVSDPANDIVVSAASAWEISTKHRLGRLPAAGALSRDLTLWVERAGFAELAVRIPHAQRAGSWPQAHRDPFDRMIAAQSALEDIPVLTRDDKVAAFGVRTIW